MEKKIILIIGGSESGKGLMTQHMRAMFDNIVELDGKSLNYNYGLGRGTRLDETTDLLIVDDVPRSRIEYFYNLYDSKIELNKQNESVRYIDSPQIIINSNISKDDEMMKSASAKRRFKIINTWISVHDGKNIFMHEIIN